MLVLAFLPAGCSISTRLRSGQLAQRLSTVPSQCRTRYFYFVDAFTLLNTSQLLKPSPIIPLFLSLSLPLSLSERLGVSQKLFGRRTRFDCVKQIPTWFQLPFRGQFPGIKHRRFEITNRSSIDFLPKWTLTKCGLKLQWIRLPMTRTGKSVNPQDYTWGKGEILKPLQWPLSEKGILIYSFYSSRSGLSKKAFLAMSLTVKRRLFNAKLLYQVDFTSLLDAQSR